MTKSTNLKTLSLKEQAIAAVKHLLGRSNELPVHSNDEYVSEFIRHNRTVCEKAKKFIEINTPH